MAVFLDRAAPGPARLRADARGPADWSPTSCAGSTGCRWPSSSPPAGCPPSPSPTCTGRLDRSLDLLGGGRPSGDARHRTLRATVEWSYQLLTDDERRLFRHLSVFVDGVDLDTAERLAADLGLARRPRQRAGPPRRRLDDRRRVRRAAPATGCWRRCGRSGSTGWPPTGEAEDADERLLRLGGRADRVDRRDRPADRARARGRRRAAPRAAEPAGGVAAGPRPREPSTTPPRWSPRLLDAIAYRDLDRDPRLGRGAGRRPGARRPPPRGRRAGHRRRRPPTTAATTRRGRAARPRRAASGPTDDAARWCCLAAAVGGRAGPRGVRRGRRALPRRRRARDPAAARTSASPPSPRPTRATSTGRGSCNDRGGAGAASPSMRAWAAYVAGEIESLGRRRRGGAEQHYRAGHRPGPRRRARPSSSGVATVGLLTVRADAGRVARGAARLPRGRRLLRRAPATGPTCGPTLRNLADLLRRLGDHEPAAVLDAAADQAPDAPAATTVPGHRCPSTTAPSRTDVLDGRPERDRAEPQTGGEPTSVPVAVTGARAASTNDSSPTHAV